MLHDVVLNIFFHATDLEKKNFTLEVDSIMYAAGEILYHIKIG